MLLDDTRHTTYIYNLDQELAEPEPSEKLIILPLAARMMSVPESVLSSPAQSQELVLYSEPTSLTVPKEKDSVRKAIIESRARARASQSKPVDHVDHAHDTLRSDSVAATASQEDDPMDIDPET